VPIYYNYLNTGRPAAETGLGAGNRFTSKYLDVSFTPEYPFGYGLSYTEFEYSNLQVSTPEISMGGTVEITADIANTGEAEAVETVQLYTHDVTASLVRPVRGLKAFQRVRLKPGEKRSVAFTLNTSDLAFHNGAQQVVEPGLFEVWIAPNATSGVRGHFEVVE